MVKLLLKNKAAVEIGDKFNSSPLMKGLLIMKYPDLKININS